MISALPPRRWATRIFTVEFSGPLGAGFLDGAAVAPAGAARARISTGRTRALAHFTGEILLTEQGDRIVQHVQDDPRNYRPGLLVEQRQDEAEDDQRRHRLDPGQGVERAEDGSA